MSRDRQSLWNKVDATREEYACLKEQHQREMEEQEKKLMKARDVSVHPQSCMHVVSIRTAMV